jgi:hypothetical protein
MAQVDTNIAFTFTDLLTIDTDATITSLSCWGAHELDFVLGCFLTFANCEN